MDGVRKEGSMGTALYSRGFWGGKKNKKERFGISNLATCHLKTYTANT